MPDLSIYDMEECLMGPDDCKKKNVVLAPIKRGERKTIKYIVQDLHKSPGTYARRNENMI